VSDHPWWSPHFDSSCCPELPIMIGDSGGGATGVRLSWQLSPGATNHLGFGPYVALQCGRAASSRIVCTRSHRTAALECGSLRLALQVVGVSLEYGLEVRHQALGKRKDDT
jgi:hypothetical protein